MFPPLSLLSRHVAKSFLLLIALFLSFCSSGIKTGPDARFFAISSKTEAFDNANKDLVLQFQVKHEQDLDCGGGYVKLLPGEVDQKTFGGDTPYRYVFKVLLPRNTSLLLVLTGFTGT